MTTDSGQESKDATWSLGAHGGAPPARRRRLQLLILAVVAALVIGACGGDDDSSSDADAADDGGETPEESASSVPAECEIEPPFTLEITGGDALPQVDADGFDVTSVIASQQPIVPDPDGELTPDEIREQGATTPLVSYAVYLADFEMTAEDVGFLGPTPPDDGTLFFVAVVPPTEDGLRTGDVVEQGTPEFESVTTFGSLGVQYQTGTVDDAPTLALDGDGTGTAEVLYLDDDRICLDVEIDGTMFGGETGGEPWSIDTVVSAELAPRSTLPFT